MSRSHRGDSKPTADELLAAYAANALDGAEADAVEEHMAAHPEARVEMEALRDAIVTMRSSRPAPPQEPDWAAMRRQILAQCEPVDARAPQRRRFAEAVRALATPRAALASAAVAAAAVALVLAWRGADRGAADREVAPRDSLATAEKATPDGGGAPELRAAEVDELDEPELQTLLGELDLSAVREIEPDDSLLPEEMAAEWAELPAAQDQDGEIQYAAAIDVGVFAEPDYDSWLDGLAETEIEALIEFLDEAEQAEAG